jgi:hypothetical protein
LACLGGLLARVAFSCRVLGLARNLPRSAFAFSVLPVGSAASALGVKPLAPPLHLSHLEHHLHHNHHATSTTRRQTFRASLTKTVHPECTHCAPAARLRSPHSTALTILPEVHLSRPDHARLKIGRLSRKSKSSSKKHHSFVIWRSRGPSLPAKSVDSTVLTLFSNGRLVCSCEYLFSPTRRDKSHRPRPKLQNSHLLPARWPEANKEPVPLLEDCTPLANHHARLRYKQPEARTF